MSFTSYMYKLRSSGPFPVNSKFIAHTFKAEKNEVIVHEAITDLKVSTDMAGQEGEYVSISYSSHALTLDGELAFQGTEIKKPEYIDEDSIPGAST